MGLASRVRWSLLLAAGGSRPMVAAAAAFGARRGEMSLTLLPEAAEKLAEALQRPHAPPGAKPLARCV